jgi:hypothetical protein
MLGQRRFATILLLALLIKLIAGGRVFVNVRRAPLVVGW